MAENSEYMEYLLESWLSSGLILARGDPLKNNDSY